MPAPIKPILEISSSKSSHHQRNAKELESQSKTSKKVDNMENKNEDLLKKNNIKNDSATKDLVLCMLKIDEGRKFAKPTCNQSLYLKARFFSDSEHISSPVCWMNTIDAGESQPHFELHHVVPMETNLDFLEANCKQNHLVVEVWNFSEPSSNLIGVAMVPLHQLYATFSVSMIKTCSFENFKVVKMAAITRNPKGQFQSSKIWQNRRILELIVLLLHDYLKD